MIGRIFTIGTLFAFARRASQEARLDELRANTAVAAREARQAGESASREQNLQHLRAESRAQMQMSLAESGVNPMFMLDGGPGGGVRAAHIQQAAVNNAMLGTRHGY